MDVESCPAHRQWRPFLHNLYDIFRNKGHYSNGWSSLVPHYVLELHGWVPTTVRRTGTSSIQCLLCRGRPRRLRVDSGDLIGQIQQVMCGHHTHTFLSKATTQNGAKVVNERRATATSATFRFLNPRNPPRQPPQRHQRTHISSPKQIHEEHVTVGLLVPACPIPPELPSRYSSPS